MQKAEVTLPSLRSLGLLDYYPSGTTSWEDIPPTLPPLRLLSDPNEDMADFPHALAWGSPPMTQTPTQQGQQPSQETTTQDNPSTDAVPEAGTPTIGTDEQLVPAEDIHPQMAGEDENGGNMLTFHQYHFKEVNGRTERVEWINLSA